MSLALTIIIDLLAAPPASDSARVVGDDDRVSTVLLLRLLHHRTASSTKPLLCFSGTEKKSSGLTYWVIKREPELFSRCCPTTMATWCRVDGWYRGSLRPTDTGQHYRYALAAYAWAVCCVVLASMIFRSMLRNWCGELLVCLYCGTHFLEMIWHRWKIDCFHVAGECWE